VTRDDAVRRGPRRRDLVGLAAAALLASRSSPAAAAPVDDDGDVLVRLIALEDAAASADTAAAPHERAHAQALRTLLDALGRQAPRDPAAAPEEPEQALESALIAAYSAALIDLHDPSILRTVGTILASHSQHRVRARLQDDLDPFTSDP
jgi:hypothetical protein